MLKTVIAVVIGYLIGVAGQCHAAEPHHNHPQDLPLHEAFYQFWKMPDIRSSGVRTTSCCSKEDCYPTEIKLRGKFYYALRREDNRWVQIPDRKLEQNYMRTRADDGQESPDGQSHVCMSKPAWGYDGYVYGDNSSPKPPAGPSNPDDFEIANDSSVYCATIGSGM